MKPICALLITLTWGLFISTCSLTIPTSSPTINLWSKYKNSSSTLENPNLDGSQKLQDLDALLKVHADNYSHSALTSFSSCEKGETQCGIHIGLAYCCGDDSRHVCCPGFSCCPSSTTCCGKYCCESGDVCKSDGCYRWERKTYFIPVGLIITFFCFICKFCRCNKDGNGAEPVSTEADEGETT